MHTHINTHISHIVIHPSAFNITSTPLLQSSALVPYLLRLPLSCDWTGGSSLQHCAHERVVIEQCHLPLPPPLARLLALPLNRDRREGKRDHKEKQEEEMGREGDVMKNIAR